MTNDQMRWSMVWYLLSLTGRPYRWGGEGPAFDCSGLAQEGLRSIGMDPPNDQAAQGLYRHFKRSGVYSCGPGCLLFYGRGLSIITHVAIGINDDQVIEAGGGGSKTTSDDIAQRQSAFVRVRPWDHRSDLVAIVDPFHE